MKKLALAIMAGLVCGQVSSAQQTPAAVTNIVNSVQMRNIGPFRSAAWVTSLAIPDGPPHEHLYTIYAAVRSGGLWKTINSGVSWEPVTDSIGTIASVGAVAIVAVSLLPVILLSRAIAGRAGSGGATSSRPVP